MIKPYRTLILLFTFLCSSMLYGQSYVGAFIGLNSSKLAGDAPEKVSYKSKMGVNTGAFIDIKLGKALWLSLQPSYSQEGSKLSYTLDGKKEPVDSLKVGLDYFSLPVLFKVSTSNGKFYAIGGIEAAYLLNSYQQSNDQKMDLNTNVSEYNIAAHFGAGMNIPIGWPRLFFELRYTQGVINITEDPLVNNIIPRVKTSGYKAIVGIEIPLKKENNP